MGRHHLNSDKPENTSLARVYIQIIWTYISFHIWCWFSLHWNHAVILWFFFSLELAISSTKCSQTGTTECGTKFRSFARCWRHLFSNSSRLFHLITTLHNFRETATVLEWWSQNVFPHTLTSWLRATEMLEHSGRIHFKLCDFFFLKSSMPLLIAI